MFSNRKKPSNASSSEENIDSAAEGYPYQSCSMNNSYNHESSFASPSENENDSESGVNDHVSRLTQKWSSVFTMKNTLNHSGGAVSKNSMLPPIKIRTKNKVKKLKRKKSRVDRRNYNDLPNQHDNNVLKTRLKLGPKGYSSSKRFKSKQKPKIHTNSLNGTNSAGSDVDLNYYDSNLVPNELSGHGEAAIQARLTAKDYNGGGQEEAQYAQYLELKPSVKFKCCRCGVKDFSTMALLQEHMANCDGHSTVSVTERSPSHCQSLQHTSVARNLKIKRKVLLCSSCGTYYQHYNLYIHMRETHNKQICLFCRNTFSKPEQLWDHLIGAHNLNSMTYSTATQVRDAFKSFYITCCTCNSVFSDQDKFDEHKCEQSTDLPASESYCSTCRPVNQQESPAKRTDDYPEDDGETSDFTSYPEDESLATISPLTVIGVTEKHTVTSCLDEMGTSEMEVEPNVQPVAHTPEHPHPTLQPKEIDQSDESLQAPPANDEVEEEVKSPAPSSLDNIEPPEEVSKDMESNDAEMQDEASLLTANPSAEGTVDPLPSEVPEPAFEPAINEPVVPKVEDTGSNWLDSDDEDISTPVQPVTEIEPVKRELSPQPVTLALMLDELVASLSVQTVIKECVKTSCSTCLYCNNATVISVDSSQLAAHLRSEHRFMPTKLEDSAEEVTKKLDEGIMDLKTAYMWSSSVEFDGTFACLQCTFCTSIFKDLCHHKRKLHHKVIFPCIMCKCNFLHYSQLLCHFCPGQYSTDAQHTLTYHCCFCNIDAIPSAFRLMVHLRKMHKACDICLTRCNTQSELFSHMIKQHKINHVCFKCNLAYRSRDGIHEHLFWKHGTESVVCKRCLLKKWPHAYHFCIPAAKYTCEECNRSFTKPAALTVHRRVHNGEFPSACTECDQRFISKKLLAAHRSDAHGIKPVSSEAEAPKDELNEETAAAPAKNEDSKKGRKKKRKKEKTDIEKPLLAELPPLNLSSESEDESAEEEHVEPPVQPAEEDHVEPPAQPAEEDHVEPPAQPAEEDHVEPPAQPAETPTEENPASVLEEETPVELQPEAVENEQKDEVPETLEPVSEEKPPPADLEEKEEEEPVACDPIPSEELFPEVTLLERMKNCLVIEHSYCLPDSIFRSAGAESTAATSDTLFEAIDPKLSSPKSGSKSRDKSACKSVTPHKRKRPAKRDSSSSDTSSDSDSSSSSCGSNCSCNQKSNSNCSSSSSGSEYSTTPDKKKGAKSSADTSKVDSMLANDEDESAHREEQYSLLNARESDLDTDIMTSDEEFYDRHPSLVVPPAETRPPELPTPPPEPLSIQITPPSAEPRPSSKKASRVRKNRKRRRAPKITINLGSQNNSNFSINLQRVDNGLISANNISSYRTFVPAAPGANQVSSSSSTPNHKMSNNVSGLSTDSKGRKSKRERVKNRFYGYSSSDEASGGGGGGIAVGGGGNDPGNGNESLKLVINKNRTAMKRPSKSKLPFLGIRAKKPLIMTPKRPPPSSAQQQQQPLTNTMAATHPSLPAHLYRMPSYIMQRQQQQQQQQQQEHQQSYYSKTSTNSSDDSDSDNLVINEPSLVERSVNSQPPQAQHRFAACPPVYLSRANGPGPAGPPMPVGSEVKLYCYCRCPYDEVSEMIGCDGKQCKIEWFHFECVGIMVPPKGQWYCPECRKNREGFSSQLV